MNRWTPLKMRLGFAALMFVMCIWFIPMFALLAARGGVFVKQFGKKPLDYADLKYSDVQVNRAVEGDCYLVYELVGINYTESTSETTGQKTSTDNYYYWVVDCDDDSLMLVRTKASGKQADSMEALVDAYWEAESLDDLADDYPGEVHLDGVFIRNDPEIVGYYNEWIAEMGEYDDSWKSLSLAPFTLDCSFTYGEHLKEFYIAAGMLVITIAAVPTFIILYRKRKRRTAAAAHQGYSPATGYNYDNAYPTQSYDPYTTYRSNTSADMQPQGNYGNSGNSSNFQSQNSYGTPSNYQSQNNYGTPSNFQSQNGYGNPSNYQSQNNYGTPNNYQSQNNYGTPNNYQSQNNYGTPNNYRSQNSYSNPSGYQFSDDIYTPPSE